jgi:hypothetical protein
MARHAEDTLRGTGISEVLDLALAVPTAEAIRTKGLVASKDGQILNLVPAVITAVCAVVTYQGAIPK